MQEFEQHPPHHHMMAASNLASSTTPTAAWEYLVIVDLEARGDDPYDLNRQEIVEWPWVVFDLRRRVVVDSKQIYIAPQWGSNPNPSPENVRGLGIDVAFSPSLKDAVLKFDTYLYHSFVLNNRTFCLLTDGPWDLRQVLALEAVRKAVPLAAHFRTYFDLRIEFAKCYPKGPQPRDRQTIADFLSIPTPAKTAGLDSCRVVADIVARLQNDAHVFANPNVIPELDWVTMPTRFPAVAVPVAAAVPVGGIVRLRGLPWTCTEQDVINFFHGLAIVPNGVHFVRNAHGKATGEAFVQLTAPESVHFALQRHKKMMGRRYIEVFKSSPVDMCNHLGRADARRQLHQQHVMHAQAHKAAAAAAAANAANAAIPPTSSARVPLPSIVTPPFGVFPSAIGSPLVPHANVLRAAAGGSSQHSGPRFQVSQPSHEIHDSQLMQNANVELSQHMHTQSPLQLSGSNFSEHTVGIHFSEQTAGSVFSERVHQDRHQEKHQTPDGMHPIMNQQIKPDDFDVHIIPERVSEDQEHDQISIDNVSCEKNGGSVGPRLLESDHGISTSSKRCTKKNPKSFVLRVCGLPTSADADDVVRLFNGLELVGDGVHVLRRPEGQGDVMSAFVEFTTEAWAKKALSRSPLSLGGSTVLVHNSSHKEMASLFSEALLPRPLDGKDISKGPCADHPLSGQLSISELSISSSGVSSGKNGHPNYLKSDGTNELSQPATRSLESGYYQHTAGTSLETERSLLHFAVAVDVFEEVGNRMHEVARTLNGLLQNGMLAVKGQSGGTAYYFAFQSYLDRDRAIEQMEYRGDVSLNLQGINTENASRFHDGRSENIVAALGFPSLVDNHTVAEYFHGLEIGGFGISRATAPEGCGDDCTWICFSSSVHAKIAARDFNGKTVGGSTIYVQLLLG